VLLRPDTPAPRRPAQETQIEFAPSETTDVRPPSGPTEIMPPLRPQAPQRQAPATIHEPLPPPPVRPADRPAAPPPPPPTPATRKSSLPLLLLGGGAALVLLCLVVAAGIAALGGPAIFAALGGATTAPPATESVSTEAGPLATDTAEPGGATEAPTGAATEAVTEAPPPTEASTQAPTAEPTPEPTPEPTDVPVPAGMVVIAGGTFNMGANAGDAAPVHSVTLSPYFIDQFEVTNARYRACVEAGQCSPPARRSSDTRPGYFTEAAFDNYPMLNVTWDQAQAFCRSEGRRLPTEAEWEYAATGGDGRLYPWGNDFDPARVPVRDNDTVAAGFYSGGASPFQVFDLAGNALEWVADWYDPNFYAVSPAENPAGPPDGNRKVLRGGSFGNPDPLIYLTTRRFSRPPAGADVDIGFRCAQTVP
jgi:formylglycine-generating enzyme required for sulfatase activity